MSEMLGTRSGACALVGPASEDLPMRIKAVPDQLIVDWPQAVELKLHECRGPGTQLRGDESVELGSASWRALFGTRSKCGNKHFPHLMASPPRLTAQTHPSDTPGWHASYDPQPSKILFFRYRRRSSSFSVLRWVEMAALLTFGFSNARSLDSSVLQTMKA